MYHWEANYELPSGLLVVVKGVLEYESQEHARKEFVKLSRNLVWLQSKGVPHDAKLKRAYLTQAVAS